MKDNMIISDTTIRIIVVKGIEEVERIKQVNKNEHIVEVEEKSQGIYEVRLIYRVGDYFKGGD